MLDALRRQSQGDPAGAWEALRLCLQSVRRVESPALFGPGDRTTAIVVPSLLIAFDRWSSDPNVDAAMLRRALEDVLAIDAPNPDQRAALRDEYDRVMKAIESPGEAIWKSIEAELNDPWDESYLNRQVPGMAWCRLFVRNEPERSRRVARLVFANWRRRLQEPWRVDPGPIAVPLGSVYSSSLTIPSVWIYPDDPAWPPSLEEKAERMTEALVFKRVITNSQGPSQLLDIQAGHRRALLAVLLAALHQRERGQPFPGDPDALIDPFLASRKARGDRNP